MNHTTHFRHAGTGRQLHAPDATLTVVVGGEHTDDGYEIFEIIAPKMDPTPLHRTGWGKSYYVLDGRMLVFVDGESFELDPGSSVAIPPRALHTFTVLTPTVRFLVFSLTGGMGRFHADLDASVPRGKPVDEVLRDIGDVLGRHDVTLENMKAVP
ncbi:cupin domain-containing protein [Mycetocola manganoxydans]|uniref:Cupin domain-containing protein n=1 Tax=Mycetocola manganoxydans TaxID=699879 RepID=A0A3L6ZXC9_9MICO|nr:cupin domain-containing protein [Mycetocola manganoxydans]RLP72567.1 cupin domain-containing protein [Mycetocola manganoxydans]GHD39735.1 hypothetical protein GCM10008097_02840 [Mycetocola manganoxydans]